MEKQDANQCVPCSEVPFSLSRLSRSYRLLDNFLQTIATARQATKLLLRHYELSVRGKKGKTVLSTELGIDVQMHTFLTSALGEREW